MVGRPEVIDSIKALSISTFGGNPVATAGALANLDYIIENDLMTNSAKVGQQLRADIEGLADEVPAIGDVRGKGLMIGVEFVTPGTMDPDAAVTARILEDTKDNGLIIGKGGLFGNALRIAPPLSITSEEATEGFEILSDVVRRATSS